MNRGTDTRPEHGFTLMEMIVVLVLLALAMAAIFPAIGNMIRGSSRSSAMSQAASEASFAARLLESDIRKALGDRGTGDRTDTYAFSGASAIKLATIPALSANDARYSDIVLAGPTQLELNADIVPNAGIERIEWVLLQNDNACGDRSGVSAVPPNANWCLRRTVRAPGGGAIISVEYPVRGRGSYPTNSSTCAPTPTAGGGPWDTSGLAAIGTPRVFCYLEAYPSDVRNPADNPVPGLSGGNNAQVYDFRGFWSQSCATRWGSKGAGNPNDVGTVSLGTRRFTTVHNAVDPAASISRLDRITTISATIIGGGSYGRASERSYEHITAAIRSRESEAYREAIMCGSRAGWGR